MSEWTVDTLREHMCEMFKLTKNDIDDRFEAQKEATEWALSSAQLAVDKAERLAEIRADAQDKLANERAKVNGTYVTTAQYDTAHGVLVEKISSFEHRHDADLAVVREQLGERAGRRLGQGQLVIWLFLAVASFVSITGIILDLTIRH